MIKTILVDFDRPLLVRIPIRIAGINPIGDLGTAPDSLITPEPATMVLLGLGGLFVGRRRS